MGVKSLLVFKNKVIWRAVVSTAEIKIMSHIIKLWDRLVEARLA